MLIIFMTVEDSQERNFISELYENTKARLIGVADHILHNYQDAEDAVQDVFLRMIPRIRKLESMSPDERAAFLAVCVMNQARDVLRKRASRKEEALTEEIPDREAETQMYSAEHRSGILRFLDRQEERKKQIFELHYIFGFRYREIADFLGMTAEAVQKTISRLKRELQAFVKEQEEVR